MHRPLKGINIAERLSCYPLEVSIHSGGSLENCREFTITFGPLLVHPLTLSIKIGPQLSELFCDALNAMFESRSGQIRINLLRLCLLAIVAPPKFGHFYQAQSQSCRYWKQAWPAGNPHTFHLVKVIDILRHRLGNDHGGVRVGRALVALKFANPGVGPRLCSLRLPKYAATNESSLIPYNL